MRIFYCIITIFLAIQTICIFNLSRQNYGRYELKQLGSARRDQFLLDKHTGKVWNIASNGKDKIYFQKVDKLEDLSGEEFWDAVGAEDYTENTSKDKNLKWLDKYDVSLK